MDAAGLEAIPLFETLTTDQRASIADACAELEVDERTVLVSEGDFGHAVFAFRSGTADVVHDGVVINTLGPGDYFGEIAVMSGRPPIGLCDRHQPVDARHDLQPRHLAPGA
jgi:CRP-like cAMP-binding protein